MFQGVVGLGTFRHCLSIFVRRFFWNECLLNEVHCGLFKLSGTWCIASLSPIPNLKIALDCLSKTKLFIAYHSSECKSCSFQKPTLFTIQLKERKTDLIGTVWMLEGGLEKKNRTSIGCSPYENNLVFFFSPLQVCIFTRSGEMTINLAYTWIAVAVWLFQC